MLKGSQVSLGLDTSTNLDSRKVIFRPKWLFLMLRPCINDRIDVCSAYSIKFSISVIFIRFYICMSL